MKRSRQAADEFRANRRTRLIVSAVELGGKVQAVSRYGDAVWNLVGGTTNVSKSRRRLDFGNVPEGFRESFKEILYTYQSEGRRNRPCPGVAFLTRIFMCALPFFRYLVSIGINNLGNVTPVACAGYVDACRAATTKKGKPLQPGSIQFRFLTVETIYDLSQRGSDPMPMHPWPDSSAQILAGVVGRNARALAGAKTPVIPDEAFVSVFQAASRVLEVADELLRLRDSWAALVKESPTKYTATNHTKYLAAQGWRGGARGLQNTLADLRTACYIVIASLSGCRNHELAYLERGATYSTVKDGERYWWMRSQSSKTYVGACEWMIPVTAVKAIRILERWATPYQAELRQTIARLRSEDPRNPAIAEAERHVKALFLTKPNGGTPATIDVASWGNHFKSFATRHGIAWVFKSHQFRRTFAIYAARSKFGDLRYLKSHFKHWSMDMSLMYALNDLQETDLLSDVASEVDEIQTELLDSWMNPGTQLAGKGGRSIVRFRDAHPIPLYRSRSEMVRSISKSVHIRSNGHAWCTADAGSECVGNGGLERSRCSECVHGVIGAEHLPFYERMRQELRGLLDLEDIGESGKARVQRDLARCEGIIGDLGQRAS